MLGFRFLRALQLGCIRTFSSHLSLPSKLGTTYVPGAHIHH